MGKDTKTGKYWMVFPKSKEAKDAVVKHGLRLYDALYNLKPDGKTITAREAMETVIKMTGVKGFCLAYIDVHKSVEEMEKEA